MEIFFLSPVFPMISCTAQNRCKGTGVEQGVKMLMMWLSRPVRGGVTEGMYVTNCVLMRQYVLTLRNA